MSIVTGSPDPETLAGTQGDDLINAYGGDDTVYAQAGNDTLYGGEGNDSLLGDFGNDLIYGEGGDDKLQSGGDTDQLFGGAGNDWIIVNDQSYDGESTGYGGAGDDVVAIFGNAHGHAYGGDGIDTLILLASGPEPLFVDLNNGTIDGHGAFPDVTFDSFERLNVLAYGGTSAIFAGDKADHIVVNGSGNLVEAGAGDDYVGYVTHGASTLQGGDGTDLLVVNSGTSSLYFIYDRTDGTVDDGQGSQIQGFERYEAHGGRHDDIVGLGAGDDLFFGAGGSDTAAGFDGNDTLNGQNGADSLTGEAGKDRLYGGAGNDTLSGGDGNDFIGGGAGDDLIFGGAGDDRIRLFTGADTITGGAGHDRFLFTLAQTGVATITDFETGTDQLRFAGIYLQAGPAAGHLDPSQLSYGAASGAQAQFVLTYAATTDTTDLTWDPNGDTPAGGSYIYAHFTGAVSLTASDFLIL